MPLQEYTGPVIKGPSAKGIGGLVPYTGEVIRPMDEKSGAPATVRAMVGAARTPEDRLATIRKAYPDAVPFGEDNFVFTDPKTRLPTIYNPKGFDAGDVASVGGEVSEMAGGIVGGALAVPGAVAAAPVSAGTSLLAVPAGIGLGAAGGRELFDRAMSLLGATEDTRNVPTRVADAGLTAGANAVGARVGDLVSQGVRATVGPVVRYARGLATQTAGSDAARLGVEPTAGMVTANRGVQIAEQSLGQMPGGAGPMQEAAERVLTQMDQAAQNVGAQYGRAQTQQGAGGVMRQAAENAAERFAERRQVLDDQLGQLIGDDTMVPTPNVRALVTQLEAELAEAPASRAGVLQGTLDRARAILEDVAPTRNAQGQATSAAGLRFRTLRQIRTDIGRDLERPDVSGYTPASEAAARRLYAALSEDVSGAARGAGPDALSALRTHDRYVRFNRNTTLPTLQKIADAGTDEHAFNIAMSAAKDGGSTLGRLRRSYTPEEWGVVASSVLSKLGRANAGKQEASGVGEVADTFSPSTFLTNWSKLAPESKIALFGGTRYRDVVPELDALVRTAGRIRDAEKMANPSGTARNVIAAFTVLGVTPDILEGDVGGAGATVAGAVLAPRMAARLLTNPNFVRWLSATGNSVVRNPSNWGVRLGQLTAIAKAEPEIRDEIYQYVAALRDTGKPQKPNAGPQ